MELFQLRSFLEVAERGNVTRAADALCLTQPAVTQQIQVLERELGVRLFDRTGRGVRLTQAGEALRDRARQSIAILDECRQAILDLEQGAGGRLVVGAGVTTSIFHLPRWLRAFRERFPAVDVIVCTGRSREVASMAVDREIDLGLVTSSIDHPDLDAIPVLDEEIVLVAPPDYPVGTHRMTIDELAVASLILFPHGTGFRDYLDRELGGAGVRPTVKMETDSVEAIKSFVEVGLGLSFLPEAAVRAELAAGSLYMVEVDGLPRLARTTSLILRRDRYRSAAARGLIKILTT